MWLRRPGSARAGRAVRSCSRCASFAELVQPAQRRLARLGSRHVIAARPGDRVHVRGMAHSAPRRSRALLAGIALAVRAGAGAHGGAVDRRGHGLAVDASLSMLAHGRAAQSFREMKQEIRRLRALSPGDRIGSDSSFAGRSCAVALHARRRRARSVPRQPRSVASSDRPERRVAQRSSRERVSPRITNERCGSSARHDERRRRLGTEGRRSDRSTASEESRREPRHGRIRNDSRARRFRSRRQTAAMTTKTATNGDTVIMSHYQPEVLKAAAEAAGGTFIAAGATDKAARIKAALARLPTPVTRHPRWRRDRAALSVVPLASVLIAVDRHRADRTPVVRSLHVPAAAARTAAIAGASAVIVMSLNGCASISRTRAGTRARHPPRCDRRAGRRRSGRRRGRRRGRPRSAARSRRRP